MILPLSDAVLDDDIQGFFSWPLTGHSLPLEPFLVTHLLHFLSTSYDYLDGCYRASKSSVSVISNLEFLWEIQIGSSTFCIFRWKSEITIIIHKACFLIVNRAIVTRRVHHIYARLETKFEKQERANHRSLWGEWPVTALNVCCFVGSLLWK